MRSMCAKNSSLRRTTSSAAADGVGARRSATKSADREVGFVADAGNHRHRRGDDRARQHLFVERPQVFERSAAARDDDHVDGLDARDLADRVRDFAPRAFALHARRRNHQVRVRIAPPQHADDVAQRRAVDRGDEADAAGQRRQRPLARLDRTGLRPRASSSAARTPAAASRGPSAPCARR